MSLAERSDWVFGLCIFVSKCSVDMDRVGSWKRDLLFLRMLVFIWVKLPSELEVDVYVKL